MVKMAGEGLVDVGHAGRNAECGEAGDGEFGNAAGDNAAEMREIRVDIDRQAVQGYPAPDAYADGSYFCFPSIAVVAPDAYAPLCAARGDAEIGEGIDHPALDSMNEPPDIAAALRQVELNVGNALPRTMIGVAPAATSIKDGKALVD